MAYDADFWRNSVLLHGAALTDSSNNALTVTANGSAAISSAQSKFGGSSILTGPTGASYISLPSSTGFYLPADFTIEMFVRANSFTAQSSIFSNWTAGASFPLDLIINTSGVPKINANGTANVITTSGSAMSTGVWYHIALVRSGTTMTLYVNGVSYGSATYATAIGGSGGFPMYLGAYSAGAGGLFDGYIDEVRVTKGLARYTAAFTPPTAEFDGPYPPATVDLTIPMLTLAADFGGGADLTLPMVSLIADFGAGVDYTIPMLTLDAAGHDSTGENAVDYVIPMLTLQADFGATLDAILPMLVLDAQATGTALLTADLTLPMITLDAAGTGSPWSITADITLPMLTLGAHFGGGASVTLPMLTVDISATAGGILSAEITLPMLTADIQVTLQNYGWADITLPMIQPVGSMTFDIVLPMLTLDAVVSAIVTATYEAYAVNLKPSGENPVNEVTRYTNFPFTQVIRYKNSYYGVAADGLYLLEGTTDYASPAPAPIRFNWKTAQTDFKIALEKTVVSAYFGGVMGPNDTVTLYAGNKEMNAYKYTTPRGNDIQNHRQKFGRGIKARYFAVGVSGSGPLELDGAEFNINTLTRRI